MEMTEVRKLIPYGYLNRIAEKSGVSIRTVSHVMSGKRRNYKVEMAALEVAVELKEKRKELEDKL